jgi:tryptophanyl-tRNA synthetase
MAKKQSGNYQINLFVPDLHSFTTPIDHSRLQAQIMHNLKIFVAAGLPLDNEDIRIYRQSYIPAHSELTWILDCFTGFGEMNRMTQFKDKSAGLSSLTPEDAERMPGLNTLLGGRRVTVGLFNYPVLMASDILLYGAKYVPVGDDQTQHLEFTRDIAERMNKQFGDLFVVPEPVAKQHEFFGKDQGLRIKDLADPAKKMSKSDESDRGVIFMGDSPDEAAAKVMASTTDSQASVGSPDLKDRPGVANLLQILDLLQPQHQDVSRMDYKEFKGTVAGTVKDFLSDFQVKLSSVDESNIINKLSADEAKMGQAAAKNLFKVQQAVGLRPKS